jgi:ABC-type lipoprotein release transport system permease subunit
MIGSGTAIALPCAWAMGRLVEAQLDGMKPTDPLAVGAATSILTLAAFGTALIPAYRASAVNPSDARFRAA